MPLKGNVNLNKVKKIANKQLTGVYISGLTNIVEETPVDEGRTRNNWFLTVGQPFGLSSSRGKDKSGKGSLSSILTNIPNNVLGKKLYFTNNSNNINKLEYGGYPKNPKRGSWDKKAKKYVKLSKNGFSRQAETGWVRSVVIIMGRVIARL